MLMKLIGDIGMRSTIWLTMALPVVWFYAVHGQSATKKSPAIPVVAPVMMQANALTQRGKQLLAKACKGCGTDGVHLSEFGSYYTVLSVRCKTGTGEVHRHLSDFMIVIDGDVTELVGGTVADAKETANGDVAGSGLTHATAHAMHKGDVLYIHAGTPHQAILAPHATVTMLVIKIKEPDAVGK
jgi:hypothetical protein